MSIYNKMEKLDSRFNIYNFVYSTSDNHSETTYWINYSKRIFGTNVVVSIMKRKIYDVIHDIKAFIKVDDHLIYDSCLITQICELSIFLQRYFEEDLQKEEEEMFEKRQESWMRKLEIMKNGL
jgi:hypothetical protein